MNIMELHILLLVASVTVYLVNGQQYDFGAEITRQCLVPDPVGLLDCVENKVTLPYLKSWVDCTNSLGENVATSRDIINYRCKSVWEGKGVIPEVFYIKDCVIEKTGLPPKNVSAEVLGAYKECEKNPTPSQPSPPQQPYVAGLQVPAPPQNPTMFSVPISNSRPYSQQYFTLYPQIPSLVQAGPQQYPAYMPPANGAYFYSFSIQHPITQERKQI